MCTMASKAAPLRKASSGSLNTLQQVNPEDNQVFDGWKIRDHVRWEWMDKREEEDEDIPRVSKSASACLKTEVQEHLKRNINLIFFLSPACSVASLSLQIFLFRPVVTNRCVCKPCWTAAWSSWTKSAGWTGRTQQKVSPGPSDGIALIWCDMRWFDVVLCSKPRRLHTRCCPGFSSVSRDSGS